MVYSILFAALLSLDSLGVGVVCGIKSTKIPPPAKVCTAAVSALFAAVSCFLGKGAESLFDEKLTDAVGGVLMVASGILLLLSTVTGPDTDGDRDGSGVISLKEAVLLGLALSADMLGAGAGFACGEKTTVLFPLFAGGFQYLFLSAGMFFGSRMKTPGILPGKIISLVPPVIIVLLGFLKIVG